MGTYYNKIIPKRAKRIYNKKNIMLRLQELSMLKTRSVNISFSTAILQYNIFNE